MFFIYKYLFKAFSWFIILLLLAIVISLFSCNPQKHWRDRGIRKGWIDTLKVKTNSVLQVKIDTNGIANEIDTTAKKIFSLCDSLADANRELARLHGEKSDSLKKVSALLKKERAKKVIQKEIGSLANHYIVNPKLKFNQDTVLIHDKNGNLIKVWFVNDKMNLELITSKDNFKDIPLKWYQKFWWIWLLLLFAVLLSFWLAKRG